MRFNRVSSFHIAFWLGINFHWTKIPYNNETYYNSYTYLSKSILLLYTWGSLLMMAFIYKYHKSFYFSTTLCKYLTVFLIFKKEIFSWAFKIKEYNFSFALLSVFVKGNFCLIAKFTNLNTCLFRLSRLLPELQSLAPLINKQMFL